MWIRGADKWEHTEKDVFHVSDDIYFHYPSYSASLIICVVWVHGEREGGLFFSEDGCQLHILPLILKTGGGAICVSSRRDQITVS